MRLIAKMVLALIVISMIGIGLNSLLDFATNVGKSTHFNIERGK